jgi:hypothetical protein
LPGSLGVLGAEDDVVVPADSPGAVLAVGWARRAPRWEATGSAWTWLGASCWTSARRRAPTGRPPLGCACVAGEAGAGLCWLGCAGAGVRVDGEAAELIGALFSYSADGSDG